MCASALFKVVCGGWPNLTHFTKKDIEAHRGRLSSVPILTVMTQTQETCLQNSCPEPFLNCRLLTGFVEEKERALRSRGKWEVLTPVIM